MTTMNVFDMVDTWNAGGTTFTAIKMNVTDTASAAGSLLLDLQVGGTSQFSVTKQGHISANRIFAGAVGVATGIFNDHVVIATGDLRYTGTSSYSTADLILTRDAANTLALRNGLNSQVFRVYQTFTSISQNAYLSFRWAGTDCRIQTTSSGAESAGTLTFGTSGVEAWRINASNHFVAVTDNTYDIGASGANRPRNIYAGLAVITSQVQCGLNGILPSAGGGSDYLLYRNNAGTELFRMTGAGLLTFAGATSSFPALKRNGAMIETRLADDSGFAAHGAEWISITDGVTAPGAATGRARIYVDTADGDLKVIFADGTIKTIVTDT